MPPSASAPGPRATRTARLFTIALVVVVCAIAGAWILGALRWPGDRRPFAGLRPIPAPPPLPRTRTGPPPRPVDQVGVLIVLRDGQTLVSVDRNGRVMGLVDRSEDTTRLVAQVLTEGVLPRPAGIEGLATGVRATLASSIPDAVARPIEPVGTLVRDGHPTFRWRPQFGANGYRVTLRDEQGNVLHTSEVVPSTTWKVPQALEAGRTYAWTVEADGGAPASRNAGTGASTAAGSARANAVSPGDASPQSAPVSALPPNAPRFRVMDEASVRALDARLARAGRSNLLKALAYIQAGLLAEAEQSLVALSTDNDGSDRVRGLVEQIREMRTNPAKASAAPASAASSPASASAPPKVR